MVAVERSDETVEAALDEAIEAGLQPDPRLRASRSTTWSASPTPRT